VSSTAKSKCPGPIKKVDAKGNETIEESPKCAYVATREFSDILVYLVISCIVLGLASGVIVAMTSN